MPSAEGAYLVTGAAGMLGGRLLRAAPGSPGATGVDRPDADLADPGDVERLFRKRGPFAGVLHAAGFTAVDLAEESEPQAHRDNANATGVLARACAKAGIPLLVVSTDFVFDGRAGRPYREEDEPAPLGAYGRSKLAAERAALRLHPRGTRVVRTQWLYGPGGRHFPGRILELAREREELRVVADQVGCPTSTLELAPVLWDVLLLAPPGVYHAACEGSCSRYELAAAVLEEAGVTGIRVIPCTTDEVPRPAPRPAYSVLDCSRLAALRGRRLAHWREALRRYLEAEPE
jgi:dTDP-4-dehydrorhamnose reductase